MHIRYILKTVLKRTFFENTGCFCSIVKRHLLICCINSVDCCWSLFFFFKPLCEKTNFQNKILFSVPKYERFGPLGVRQVKARTARGSLKRSSDRSKTEKTYVRTTLVLCDLSFAVGVSSLLMMISSPCPQKQEVHILGLAPHSSRRKTPLTPM